MIIFREKLEILILYKVLYKLYNRPTNFHDQNEALRALSIVNRLLNIVKTFKLKVKRKNYSGRKKSEKG